MTVHLNSAECSMHYSCHMFLPISSKKQKPLSAIK